MNVPDLIEPIIAFRQWNVCYDHDAGYDRLWSHGAGNSPWWPEMEARCAGGHKAPDPECQCGLYGWFDVDCILGDGTSLSVWQSPTALKMPPTHVVGAIAVWGDVEVYAGGVRAERAKIVALAGEGERIEELAKRYGVPLVSQDALEAEALKHGKPVPDEMRPPEPEGIVWAGGGTAMSFRYQPVSFSNWQSMSSPPIKRSTGDAVAAVLFLMIAAGWVVLTILNFSPLGIGAVSASLSAALAHYRLHCEQKKLA